MKVSTGNRYDNEEVDIYEIPKGGPYEGKKVDAIATDRPIIIHLPSMALFNNPALEPKQISANHHYIAQYFFHNDLPDTPRAVYVLHRKEHKFNQTEENNLLEHSLNEDLITPAARTIVHKIFSPMIPDLKTSPNKAQDVLKAQQAMSRVLFSGYSLGTSYIQQIRNGLIDVMALKGYDEKQQESVLNCLAAISIGTVIPVKDRGKADMPTLHMALLDDAIAEHWAPTNTMFVEDSDDNRHVKVMRTGTHLYAMPCTPPGHSVKAATLEPQTKGNDFSNPHSRLDLKDADGKPMRQWAISLHTKQDFDRHDPRLTTNTTSLAEPTMLTLQSSPGADALQAYVADAITAASDSIRTGKPRNGIALLDRTQHEYLSADARKRSAAKADQHAKTWQELVEFTNKYPDNSIER